MCGFAVVFGVMPAAERRIVLQRMVASLVHRGPDADGCMHVDNVSMGFRRLAIIDTSTASDQPMFSIDGELVIVFNGEIYNYIELRAELERAGYVFRSRGDTEVLLYAYRHWGKACLARLRGMWAFVIFDRRDGKLFVSRDRFGIKPLYIYRRDGLWLIASEIKAIRASGCYAGEVNWQVAARYLVSGALDDQPSTFFTGITPVESATLLELLPDGTFVQSRYWAPPNGEAAESRESAEQAGEEYAALFEETIRMHSRSDHPVAVHLSGGLDSTSILCELARAQATAAPGAKLLAFSFLHSAFDERAYIEETVRQTGAQWTPLRQTSKQMWAQFPRLLEAHDEPAHSMTALVSFALMSDTASRGIRVVMSGQGADETLAGYPWYFTPYWQELLANGRLGTFFNETRDYATRHRQPFAAIVFKQLKTHLQAALGRSCVYRRLRDARQACRAHPWFSAELNAMVPPPIHHMSAEPPSLRGALVRSIQSDALPIYLRVEDRNSMAHSIEVRVPFLDHRLVELALRLPSGRLLQGGWNKLLLRTAMQRRIPESIRTRPDKMGFPTPAADWIRSELADEFAALVHDRSLDDIPVFNSARIRQDFGKFMDGDTRFAGPLFRVAQFVLWWHHVVQVKVNQ